MSESEAPKTDVVHQEKQTSQKTSNEKNNGGGPQGNRGRSRRRRRPRRRRKGPAAGPQVPVHGYLWIRDKGQPILVDSKNAFSPEPDDAIAPLAIIRPLHLESGLRLEGQAKSGGERPRLVEIDTIEGMPPAEYREKALPFKELVSIDPIERFHLETDPSVLEMRVSELIAPLGIG